jgi:carboxymethylenebutenolidase
MLEHEFDIKTRDGAMNAFVTYPEEGGPFPPVLFYMDAPGKREELHDMARRIASVGYYVVLPNLYYRRTREFTMARDDEGMRRMFELMGSLSNTLIVQDTDAMLAAAAHFQDRIAAVASIYGAQLITDKPDSAHLTLDRIRGEVYLACAEIDRWAPREQIEQLGEILEKSGVNHRIEWYPGAEHGFAFPQRQGVYHKPSAERHWERLFALFARNL